MFREGRELVRNDAKWGGLGMCLGKGGSWSGMTLSGWPGNVFREGKELVRNDAKWGGLGMCLGKGGSWSGMTLSRVALEYV